MTEQEVINYLSIKLGRSGESLSEIYEFVIFPVIQPALKELAIRIAKSDKASALMKEYIETSSGNSVLFNDTDVLISEADKPAYVLVNSVTAYPVKDKGELEITGTLAYAYYYAHGNNYFIRQNTGVVSGVPVLAKLSYVPILSNLPTELIDDFINIVAEFLVTPAGSEKES
jgi:hypothetical protein